MVELEVEEVMEEDILAGGWGEGEAGAEVGKEGALWLVGSAVWDDC